MCLLRPSKLSVLAAFRIQLLRNSGGFGPILGIPWLYSMDAKISVRRFTLAVGDITMGEEVREAIGPEMIFCKDHSLIMYPKSAMARRSTENGGSHQLPHFIVPDSSPSDSVCPQFLAANREVLLLYTPRIYDRVLSH